MEQTFRFSKFLSHIDPDKALDQHLIGVYKLARLFLSEKPQNVIDKFELPLKIVTFCHDLGKATRYFQEYLLAEKKEKNKQRASDKTNHSPLSALFALYSACKLNLDLFTQISIYFTVHRHHGKLTDIMDEFQIADKDINLWVDQIHSIEPSEFEILANNLYNASFPIVLNLQEVENFILNINSKFREITRFIRKNKFTFGNYSDINFLFSLLLDADKSDVVLSETEIFEQRVQLRADLVENYLNKISSPNLSINSLRNRAFREVISNSNWIDTEKRIFSLALPTGLGKTLISLAFALKLRNQLGTNHRIIYCLPFLSVIDQNYNVFENVFTTNAINPSSNVLLKHHHLSEIYYHFDKNNYDLNANEMELLIEGWNSEIIVTTFVQLFHTLFTNKNRALRKFHRLANSIIILDEVQTIPIKYWKLVRKILDELTNSFNSYIVFVTATMPMIYSPNETYSLCHAKNYFSQLNRIDLFPQINQKITLEQLAENFPFSNKSHLFIFNTISSAKKFYEMLKSKDYEPEFLSSHVIPKHRLERIDQIKEGKHRLVVSTQIVEAGVDIDFDVVVRDFAPLDSINQSSGRCNRNNSNNEKGKIFLFECTDGNRSYASRIYDITLLELTRSIIENRSKIEETVFYDTINQYFVKTQQVVAQGISDRLIEAIEKLRYTSSDTDEVAIENFDLIDDNFPKIDVFIEADSEATQLWQQYQELKNIEDFFQRRQEFNKIKKKFYQYIISIPRSTKNQPEFVGELGFVPYERKNFYYDDKTGYKLEEDLATMCV